ncbi:MAG: AmmeMemoRadiSam system protein A [Spirochaetales bacterium]|nr:AmmeMemoRadiSam system protein A [Spirochaetales bacterium]
MDFSLSVSEKKLLLEAARASITAACTQLKPPVFTPTETLKTKCGAFVSLHKQGNLRGCIGYITGIAPLLQTVMEMAVSAGFQDPRFPPLKESELSHLEIEISVLSPLHRIRSVDEIIVGTHGIIMKKGGYSGLLLPQVATEYNWNRDEFLSHTCQKAGLPSDSWKHRDAEIQIFSAIIFSEKSIPMESGI